MHAQTVALFFKYGPSSNNKTRQGGTIIYILTTPLLMGSLITCAYVNNELEYPKQHKMN